LQSFDGKYKKKIKTISCANVLNNCLVYNFIHSIEYVEIFGVMGMNVLGGGGLSGASTRCDHIVKN
jgi:hypothetical protein